MKRLGAAIALACAAPQTLAAQVIAEPSDVPEASPRPVIDPASLDEEGLRALVSDRRHMPAEQAAAIRELRRRFHSAATDAFTQNAEGTAALDDLDGPGAYRRFTKVRATYAGSAHPAVEAEVVRAIQGQAQAQDIIDSGDPSGPMVPVTAETIRLDTLSHRLRVELVETYGRRAEPDIRRVVAQERFNLAVADAIASNFGNGPELLLGIVRDYDGSPDPAVQWVLADVFSTLAHFEPDRRKQPAWHGEIIRRFSASRDPVMRGKVSDAFANKAHWLGEIGEAEAARQATRDYDEWSLRDQ